MSPDWMTIERDPRSGALVAVLACDSITTRGDCFNLVTGLDWTPVLAGQVPGDREVWIYYRRDHVCARAWVCHARLPRGSSEWLYSFDNDPADRLACIDSLQDDLS